MQISAPEQLSLTAFLRQHRSLSLSLLALVAALVAVTALGIATSSSAPLNDTTTCARWSAAHQSQQMAYAQLYLQEHGSLPGGARDSLSVYNEINNSCLAAYNSGDEDTVTLLKASRGDY